MTLPVVAGSLHQPGAPGGLTLNQSALVSKRYGFLVPDGSDRVRAGGRPDDNPADRSTDDSSYRPAHYSADNCSRHRAARRAGIVRYPRG
jgi:hypothetical protein